MKINVLTYNVHKGVGWGIRRNTTDQIKLRIHEHQPDIVFLQETRGEQIPAFISDFCPHSAYGKNRVVRQGDYGNVILSKFPIIYSTNLDLSTHRYERRGLLHAIVQFADTKTLHLLCVHLGLFMNGRRQQLEWIVEYIQNRIGQKEAIILSGDFNDWTRYATKPLIKNLQMEEAFLNHRGQYAMSFPAWAPVLPLDRIYYRGFSVYQAERLAGRDWRFLSDHIALTAQLEWMENNE